MVKPSEPKILYRVYSYECVNDTYSVAVFDRGIGFSYYEEIKFQNINEYVQVNIKFRKGDILRYKGNMKNTSTKYYEVLEIDYFGYLCKEWYQESPAQYNYGIKLSFPRSENFEKCFNSLDSYEREKIQKAQSELCEIVDKHAIQLAQKDVEISELKKELADFYKAVAKRFVYGEDANLPKVTCSEPFFRYSNDKTL